MAMRQLFPGQIAVNQPLPWDVLDAMGNLLLRKGFVVDTDRQIEALLERGMFVDADQYKKTFGAAAPVVPEPTKFSPFILWDDIQVKLGKLLREAKETEEFAMQTEGLARLIQFLVSEDADASIGSIMLNEVTKYSVSHSLHVGVVAELVAKRMNLSEDNRIALLCAALTMNISVLELQNRLHHQSTPLTPLQKAQIEDHPATSTELLKEIGVTNEAWLKAVLQHHEKPDGSGYPNKVPLTSHLASIMQLVDTFCAMVVPRTYKKSLPPTQVMKALFVEEGQKKKNPVPAILIKEVGIYPPGCFVRLANGESALVVRRGEQANTPNVASISGDDGRPYMEPLFRETSRKEFEITATVPREKIMARINAAKVWGYN